MSANSIEAILRDKISQAISVKTEGVNKFRVFTPFQFSDGDHFKIILEKSAEGYRISDEADTFLRLSYDLDLKDLNKGTRAKIISQTLSNLSMQEDDGELVIAASEANLGDALFNFIQGLTKIADVTYLKREIVRSTFYDDFKSFISYKVPKERFSFDYNDKTHDPQAKYTIDCRINNMKRPIFLYAINNDDKCRDATINLLKLESWKIDFRSVAIFEDQEQINRNVLARFSDIVEKQFSSLAESKERIEKYLKDSMAAS